VGSGGGEGEAEELLPHSAGGHLRPSVGTTDPGAGKGRKTRGPPRSQARRVR
jgi:hypothetical protein